MKSLTAVLLISFFAAAPVLADDAVVAKPGMMLKSSDGARLGQIDSLAANGSPKLIFEGRLVTVPASTLTMADGKLMTSLTKNQVVGLH